MSFTKVKNSWGEESMTELQWLKWTCDKYFRQISNWKTKQKNHQEQSPAIFEDPEFPFFLVTRNRLKGRRGRGEGRQKAVLALITLDKEVSTQRTGRQPAYNIIMYTQTY
jgi:hypothetical protein